MKPRLVKRRVGERELSAYNISGRLGANVGLLPLNVAERGPIADAADDLLAIANAIAASSLRDCDKLIVLQKLALAAGSVLTIT